MNQVAQLELQRQSDELRKRLISSDESHSTTAASGPRSPHRASPSFVRAPIKARSSLTEEALKQKALEQKVQEEKARQEHKQTSMQFQQLPVSIHSLPLQCMHLLYAENHGYCRAHTTPIIQRIVSLLLHLFHSLCTAPRRHSMRPGVMCTRRPCARRVKGQLIRMTPMLEVAGCTEGLVLSCLKLCLARVLSARCSRVHHAAYEWSQEDCCLAVARAWHEPTTD